MISERKLNLWRKRARKEIKELEGWNNDNEFTSIRRLLANRNILLIEEILERNLLTKRNKQ